MLKKAELVLRKGADRRLRGGHCWVYSNEVDTTRTPLNSFAAGDDARLLSSGGEVLGSVLVEPQSLICARRYTRDATRDFNLELCRERVVAALELRERFFSDACYRLIYGDSDGLPGIVVDRFADTLVVQVNTAGAELHRDILVQALIAEVSPTGILVRGDSRARREQDLPELLEVVHGDVPDLAPLVENNTRFLAPVRDGQKTGWFYDHRSNRARLQQLCRGRRVLDVYSYIGGWGIQAAVAGASEVLCVDSSAQATAWTQENAELNDVAGSVSTHTQKADQAMIALAEAGERFDIVVLDPPAFIPRKRDLNKGRKAYRRINELALRLLDPGGLLISASCSMHLAEADLIEAVRGAGQRAGRETRILEMGCQAADHPVHPAIPETRYLKMALCAVTPSG